MSNQSVHDVLSAISVAKDALDAKPALESRIAALEAALANAERHNQSLELSIIDYKSEIDAKNKIINDQEGQLTDMALTAKEMEDRQKAVSRFLGSLVGDASTLNEVLNPPAPIVEPPVVDQPVSVEPAAQAEPTPVAGGSEAPSVGTSEVGQSTDASTFTATPPTGQPRRYSGKLYYFQPRWISRAVWINEGGTNYSYDWRPDVNNTLTDKEQIPYGHTADIA